MQHLIDVGVNRLANNRFTGLQEQHNADLQPRQRRPSSFQRLGIQSDDVSVIMNILSFVHCLPGVVKWGEANATWVV